MRIVILATKELPSHVLFFISESSDEFALTTLQSKYGVFNLRVLFSALAKYKTRMFAYEDLYTNDVDSIRKLPPELRMFLESHKSPIGDDVFRCNSKDLVRLSAEFFQDSVICTSSLKNIVEGVTEGKERSEREHGLRQKEEREFFKTFEIQCRELNEIWESHWDKWVSEFTYCLKMIPFPAPDHGLWGREKKRQEFNLRKAQYVKIIVDLTRKWREESRYLPTTFSAKCRSCGGDGVVSVHAIGPGNHRTYGGQNRNTVAQEQGKPATVECGRKLLDGRKYFYRHIHNLSGSCRACGKSLFQKMEFGTTNYALLDWEDRWCVFPFRDVESWWEWCGIWMTIYDWESHTKLPYEARDVSYEFFSDFNRVVDVHWHCQYPPPQLPE
jgi:hypothetical protein